MIGTDVAARQGRVYVGDTKTRLLFHTNIPVESVTVAELWCQIPSGTATKSMQVKWADLAGSPAYLYKQGAADLYYDVAATDFDQPGYYRFQLYIEVGASAWTGRSRTSRIRAVAHYA